MIQPDLRAQFQSMFCVQTDPIIVDGRKKRVELNQERIYNFHHGNGVPHCKYL